jgi:hypothetical protein
MCPHPQHYAQRMGGSAFASIARSPSSAAAKALPRASTTAGFKEFVEADRGTDLRTMQDYLGHRDPRHTVHYTRVAGRRFEGLWK